MMFHKTLNMIYRKILAWFIIYYFTHNIDIIEQARKNFRPQSTNDDTVIAEQSDYIWDPEWSHPLFLNIPVDISSQAINTISIHPDYVKRIPLTIDATPLNYNTFSPYTQNNSLNSTVIHHENLNGTRNLTPQDIQTPSHFINEEIVNTTATTTPQSISAKHRNLTTPRNTNTTLPQVTLQSTVKPSVAPKYSHMDYQTFRPRTKQPKLPKTFTRSNFAERNYNYVNPSRTNQPLRKNNNHEYSRNWNVPNTSTNSVNFQNISHPPQDHNGNYPFFQQNKNKQQTPYYSNILSSDDDDYFQPNIFAPYTQGYRTQRPRQSQPFRKKKVYPQNQADIQNQQPMHIPNSINTQSFQAIQSPKPMTMHSYQPNQMQNEIPLPCYLQ